ncbi:hypothetical protein BGW41_004637 [Actinomortierella wolfii]|nr:hypothetical protein BGW41_004637 [Actinomortierella wolfii]
MTTEKLHDVVSKAQPDTSKPVEKKKIYNLHNNIFEQKGGFKVKNPPKKRTTPCSNSALQGNYYPVFDETEGDDGLLCEVEGTIPECLLDSQYVRTGPNTLNVPEGRPHHFFEGEGMLHGVYFASAQDPDGRRVIQPRYMNRWVRSQATELANKHGHIVPTISVLITREHSLWAAAKNWLYYGAKGVLRGLKDIGNGSISLSFFQSRLLALHEVGTPYEIEVPSLDTMGQYFFGKSDAENFNQRGKRMFQQTVTAHPKFDPKTGEMIFFRYGLPGDFCYSVVAADGTKKVWQEHIPGQTATMVLMHDFAVTDTHTIFIDASPRIEAANNIRKGLPLMGFDPARPSRYAIIPRYYKKGRDKVRWFEATACNIIHTSNAWDVKDDAGNVVAIYMLAGRSERFPQHINHPGRKDKTGPFKPPGSNKYSERDQDATYLTLFRFDLKTGRVEHTTICPISAEMPTMNWDWYMRASSRYVYQASIEEGLSEQTPKMNGIVKVDVHKALELHQKLRDEGKLQGTELGIDALAKLQEETGQHYRFPGKFRGGEALFVSRGVDREKRNDGVEGAESFAEDDGYLLVYVYDEEQLDPKTKLTIKEETEQETQLWIFDAQKIQDGPVAKIKIPRRVPYGFHGLHITKFQIEENRKLQYTLGRLQ